MPGSLSSYPDEIDSFTTHVDNVNEKIMADYINKIQDAIVATETYLTAHLADDMPHIAVDTSVSPNVTYRYGVGIQNGVWGIVYEEVV